MVWSVKNPHRVQNGTENEKEIPKVTHFSYLCLSILSYP